MKVSLHVYLPEINQHYFGKFAELEPEDLQKIEELASQVHKLTHLSIDTDDGKVFIPERYCTGAILSIRIKHDDQPEG